MRITLYTQDTASEANQCGVAVEIVCNTDELRTALRAGELTVDQVTDALKRGVNGVAKILSEFQPREKITDASLS